MQQTKYFREGYKFFKESIFNGIEMSTIFTSNPYENGSDMYYDFKDGMQRAFNDWFHRHAS